MSENQTDGLSPHDNLNPEDSAKVIINHVKNGVILAKNFKLPIQIIDFIRTHHGTTVAYYFFKKRLSNIYHVRIAYPERDFLID